MPAAKKRRASTSSLSSLASDSTPPPTSTSKSKASTTKKATNTTRKKAKIAPASDDEAPKKAKAPKKEPAGKGPGQEWDALPRHAETGMPINVVMPVTHRIPQKSEGSIRISSWNVAGYNAAIKKGLKFYIEAEDADMVVLTETKVKEDPKNPDLISRYPYQYWSPARSGQAGTAILSKFKPISHSFDLPGLSDTMPDVVLGRIVTLEYKNLWVIGTYVPNAGEKLKNIDHKTAWHDAFGAYIKKLDASKPVVWCGDINVAPTPKDITNHKTNWNKSAGHTQTETDGLYSILDPSYSKPATTTVAITTTKKNTKKTVDANDESITEIVTTAITAITIASSSDPLAPTEEKGISNGKLIDVWRELHPNDQHYTYYSYKFNCRVKGIGWRLDMFFISERIRDQVEACEIRQECYGASDHVPLVLDIKATLQGDSSG